MYDHEHVLKSSSRNFFLYIDLELGGRRVICNGRIALFLYVFSECIAC